MEQEISMNHSQSDEVTSRASTPNTEANDSYKSLKEKLTAALVNVGAKEDLVKQHAKVAEEAVAGWEKAENEVATLKQQLEAAVQQNLSLEVRTNHLDGALKECVKQLRLAKEEQENKIIQEKSHQLESTKNDPKILTRIEYLEKENLTLKFELNVQSEDLEIRTIERDLSTQAAETASKQQLESIKKVAKLEAECRKLQLLTRKSPSVNDNHKAVSVSSFYVDSLTDSQSVDSFKMNNLEHNESEDSWAVALMAELDQFKSGKSVAKGVKSDEINNIMDDFLEMERIASLSDGQNENENENGNENSRFNSEIEENSFKKEIELMARKVNELEEKLEKLQVEKCELENALNESKESLALSNAELADTKTQMADLQKELTLVNKSKELLESRVVDMEKEARIKSTEIDSIKENVEQEKKISTEMTVKCECLEKELAEVKLQCSNNELKVKQDLEVAAANRLSDCQKTISSLARQLESLATLEDFLIDTTNLPGFSAQSSVAKTGGELWKLHSNDTFTPKKTSLVPTKEAENNFNPSSNGDDDVSLNHFGGYSKSRNSFEQLFSRSKNGVEGESH